MNNQTKIENSITIVIGSVKTGVTTENKKHINRFIKERKKQGRNYRVLVIDFENEYKGTRVDVKDLKSFNNKIAIIGDYGMTIKERINLMKEVICNYRNGLLVIDSLNKSISRKDNIDELIGAVCTNRSRALDVILSFGGSFKNVPIKVWQNASYLRFHYTSEDIDIYAKKLENFDLYELAERIHGINVYKFVLIDRDNNTIFGCSKSEYLRAYKDLCCEKIQKMRNVEQIDNIPHYLIGVGFSDMKHIPISNVDRKYITN